MDITNILHNISYEMMSVIVGLLFIIMIVITLLYINAKERDSIRKILQLERSIEDLNKEIYKIQKWILESDQKPKTEDLGSKDLKDVMATLARIDIDLESLQNGMQGDREYFENKFLTMEERLRGLGHFSTPSQSRNEEQILKLFKSGHSIDSICKDLRVTRSEVEFVLKLSQINPTQD